MANEKITLLSDEPLDPHSDLGRSIEAIGAIPDAQRVVGMVDLHFKERTENPSSIAVATKERIIPKLSSVAQNCGMALVRTSARRDDFDDARLGRFFDRLRSDDDRIMRRPDLSIEDMRRIVELGARAVLQRYDLPESILENFEYGGMIREAETSPGSVLAHLVPTFTLARGRYGFGVIPAGNHFLEMQSVSEVIDSALCERYGLAEGVVTFMLHSDGGLVADDIGNLYGNRTTTTGSTRAFYALRKLLFHLADARSLANWNEKWAYYFGADRYLTISPETAEGKRYLAAKRLSMNAGYACRLETIGRLRGIAESVLGPQAADLRVLCDFSHNSILREDVGGSPLWVHRHNACRVTPGRLVFLPGYSYTSSYVCVGGAGAPRFLHTMDHGAGKTIDRFREKGLVRLLNGSRVTRSFCNESSEPRIEPHYSNEGIDKVIEVLARHDIVIPIARLTPFAGYRYYWKGRLARLTQAVRSR